MSAPVKAKVATAKVATAKVAVAAKATAKVRRPPQWPSGACGPAAEAAGKLRDGVSAPAPMSPPLPPAYSRAADRGQGRHREGDHGEGDERKPEPPSDCAQCFKQRPSSLV